jgi:hypothetical protein
VGAAHLGDSGCRSRHPLAYTKKQGQVVTGGRR